MDSDLLLAMQLQVSHSDNTSPSSTTTSTQQAEEQRLASMHVDQPMPQHPILRHITATLHTVTRYEDPLLQAMALSLMPMDTIQARARDTLDIQRRLGDAATLHEEDIVAEELTAWFKRDFFTWVDAPPCQWCGKPGPRPTGAAPPTPQEAQQGGASRVEVYHCGACGQATRFPRYNDPGTLLHTRRGRCGEWANCFTLCCRAAGLVARYCLDTTDHVWTEYWSHGQGRWVHMDPCEGIVDRPLLYEQGWGKQLQYVFGIAAHGVADITRRYSALQPAHLAARRTTIPEAALQDALASLTAQLRAELPPEARAEWERRDQSDAQALRGCPGEGPAESLPGRTTGSVAWRSQRGELGRRGGPSDLPHALPPGTRYAPAPPSAEGCLQGGAVRASGENPPSETAARAFEAAVNSKWLDFKGAAPGGCWLEYRLEADAPPVCLTRYALVSADDAPERDPCCWTLEGRETGSADMQSTPWHTLHHQPRHCFTDRHQSAAFSLHPAPPCRQFRLVVHRVRNPRSANSVQLACLQLWGAAQERVSVQLHVEGCTEERVSVRLGTR